MKKVLLAIIILVSQSVFAQLQDIPQQFEVNVNLLENPGFEQGLVKYTFTGSPTLTGETGAPGLGTVSGTLDFSATGEFFRTSVVTIPKILNGKTCIASFEYLWDAGTLTHIKWRVEDTGGIALTSDEDLVPTSGEYFEKFVTWPCNSATTARIEFESTANAAAITFESLFLGKNYKKFVIQPGGEIVFDGKFAATANCKWTQTSTSFTDFPVDADCPAITSFIQSANVTLDLSDTDLPQVVFTNLPKGKVQVIISMTAQPAASDSISVGVSDGTTLKGAQNTAASGAISLDTPITVVGFFDHTGGAKTFKLQSEVAVATGTVTADANERELFWTVILYPTDSVDAINLSTQGWYIDANIGGGNIDLGLVNVATYDQIEDASLDMIINPGSASAEIPCDGGNPSTGLTCATGNEVIGASFIAPYGGAFYACIHANVFYSGDAATDTIHTIFQIFHTNNSNQTEIAPGNAKAVLLGDGADESGKAFSVCGVFNLNAGQQTLRLKYETLIANTPLSNQILADRAATVGQRDITITVIPLTQHFPQAVALTNLDPTNFTDAEATRLGHKKYIEGTDFTITGAASFTSAQGHAIPYQMSDGTWRLRFNFNAVYGPAVTTADLTIGGVTFLAGITQTIALSTNNIATLNVVAGAAQPGVGSILIRSSTAQTDWYISGDVALDSKPTWAD